MLAFLRRQALSVKSLTLPLLLDYGRVHSVLFAFCDSRRSRYPSHSLCWAQTIQGKMSKAEQYIVRVSLYFHGVFSTYFGD